MILATLSLAACGSGGASVPPPPGSIISGSDIWRLGPTYSEFDFKSFSGTYNPVDGTITIDPASVKPIGAERQTNLPTVMPLHPDQIAVARVQTNKGEAAAAIDPKLSYALIECTSGALMGEAANSGAKEQDPPEPYLTTHPVVGEHLFVHSLITKWDGTTFYFDTEYRTVVIDVTFDGFQHATITTLTENYDRPNGWSPEAYQWVFADGEIAEEIFGKVEDDGVTITEGYMLVRTGMGQNP